MTDRISAHNARLSRLEATRKGRARAHHLATSASGYLHSVALASTTQDEAFAKFQEAPLRQQSVATVIEFLPSIKAAVEELEALLPQIQAAWSAE